MLLLLKTGANVSEISHSAILSDALIRKWHDLVNCFSFKMNISFFSNSLFQTPLASNLCESVREGKVEEVKETFKLLSNETSLAEISDAVRQDYRFY